MDFKPSDFKKLPYPVDEGIDYISQFPNLSKYPEFSDEIRSKIDFNSAFKFCILLYSPNTPLLQILDYKERKNKAFELAGMEEDPLLSVIVIGYLRLVRNHKWTKLCLWNESYYNQAQKLLSGETEPGEKTQHIIKNLDELEGRIEKTLAELTNGDNDPQLKDDIIKMMEEIRLPSDLKPENIARLLAEGKNPLGSYSPYEGK